MRRVVAGLVMVALLVPGVAVAQATTFGDGTHIVGTDINAGVWRTDGGDGCYWARLSGLGGTIDEVIINGTPPGQATVAIGADDAAFESAGCGEWTLMLADEPTAPPSDAAAVPLDLFLAGMGHFIGTLADHIGSARGFVAFADEWTDDVAEFLLSVRHDPCYAELYRESWELVGKVSAVAALDDGSRSWRRAFPSIVDDVLPVDDFEDAWEAATC